jgi:hypothetical protein
MAAAAAQRLSPSLLLLLLLLLLDVGRAAAAAASSAHLSLYIAANFRDNAATVTTFSAELLKLAADVGPPNLFVTVYESGSADGTPRLLDDARRSLEAAGVATNITANGPLTRRPAAHGLPRLLWPNHDALSPVPSRHARGSQSQHVRSRLSHGTLSHLVLASRASRFPKFLIKLSQLPIDGCLSKRDQVLVDFGGEAGAKEAIVRRERGRMSAGEELVSLGVHHARCILGVPAPKHKHEVRVLLGELA